MGEGEVKGRGKWEGGTRRRNERCPENFCSVPFERNVRSKQLKVASKMKSELVLTSSTFYVAFSFFILLYTSFLNYIKIFYISTFYFAQHFYSTYNFYITSYCNRTCKCALLGTAKLVQTKKFK